MVQKEGKRQKGGKAAKSVTHRGAKNLLVLQCWSLQRGHMRTYGGDRYILAVTSICRLPFLRSSSIPSSQGQRRLSEIRFKRLVGLIPPLSYSLPLRTDSIECYSTIYERVYHMPCLRGPQHPSLDAPIHPVLFCKRGRARRGDPCGALLSSGATLQVYADTRGR